MLGAVLAGGESRRFGSDKAAALVAGTTLVERAGSTLAAVCTEVIVVSSRPATTDRWRHVPDARPGEGPLAGIESALQYAGAHGFDGAFVLACDLPLVEPGLVAAIVAVLGDRWAAAPAREGAPGVEPLCAAYRVECLPWVTAALDRGERAAQALFDAVEGVRVPAPAGAFLNVNTPGDRERATAVLEGGAG
jgi:molybdopterin-guanine dinucleotide biosynthesis protein A